MQCHRGRHLCGNWICALFLAVTLPVLQPPQYACAVSVIVSCPVLTSLASSSQIVLQPYIRAHQPIQQAAVSIPHALSKLENADQAGRSYSAGQLGLVPDLTRYRLAAAWSLWCPMLKPHSCQNPCLHGMSQQFAAQSGSTVLSCH